MTIKQRILSVLAKTKHTYNYASNFVDRWPKTFETIGIIAITSVSIYTAKKYVQFLEITTDGDYLKTIPTLGIIIMAVIVLLYISSSVDSVKKIISNNSSLINTLLVLLTILISLSFYYTQNLNTFWKTNITLLATNHLNKNIAQGFLTDKEGKYLFWTYFITEPYEDNLSFIIKNFTQECSSRYIFVMANMKAFNELNRHYNEVVEGLSGNLLMNKQDKEVKQVVIMGDQRIKINDWAQKGNLEIDWIIQNCHNDKN